MRNDYKLINIVEERDERLSIITLKIVRCVLQNNRTGKIGTYDITFYQLVDYYDMKRYKEISESSKITIESID